MPLVTPVPAPRYHPAGKWTSVPSGVSAAAVTTQSRLYIAPFDVEQPCIVNSMGVNVSAGVLSSFVQLGFYYNNAGYVGSLQSTVAVSDTTASGNSVATGLSVPLGPGRWWAACLVQGGAPTLFMSGGSNVNDAWMPMGVQGQVFASATFQDAVASTSGLPGTFTTGGDVSACPFIQIKT